MQEAKSGADALQAALEDMRERELQQSQHVSAELRRVHPATECVPYLACQALQCLVIAGASGSPLEPCEGSSTSACTTQDNSESMVLLMFRCRSTSHEGDSVRKKRG